MSQQDESRRPRLRRRHWSLAIAVLVLATAAVGYDRFSAPSVTRVGACEVVPKGTPSQHSECAGDDLSGRSLVGVDLRLADLRKADLRNADLRGAILYGADLTGADLRGADLADSDLTQANLTSAKLDDTNFTDAGINGMNVEGTVLAATQYSEWVDSDEPALITITAGTQPGITSNSCEDRQGLYYPGQTVVNCTLSTDAKYDSTLTYDRTIELKRRPIITAPSELDLRVGRPVSVQLGADSPFPAVLTSFSGPLPTGLRWDPDTQRITGTPTRAGSTTRQFIADNGKRVQTPITFTVRR